MQFFLPLLDQAPERDDQAPGDVAAEHELLDVQAGHDGLAGAGVVGQQEPQRRARQQLAVHGLDLVRQRLHVARGHREHRVESGRHPDAQRLGGEPDSCASPSNAYAREGWSTVSDGSWSR